MKTVEREPKVGDVWREKRGQYDQRTVTVEQVRANPLTGSTELRYRTRTGTDGRPAIKPVTRTLPLANFLVIFKFDSAVET